MNRFLHTYVCVLMGLLLCCPFLGFAVDLETRFTTITYSDLDDLREFNDELYMGSLGSGIRKDTGDSIEDEVIAKIDFIVEKVMTVLDMYPSGMKFSIVIRPDEKAVKQDFKLLYDIDVDYIAFYSPSKKTVFYSANNANIRVVSHEIGHVVVEHYFNISPPQRIHEVMAQFAEQHITD